MMHQLIMIVNSIESLARASASASTIISAR